MRQYYVYMVTNKLGGTLYIGVTGDLEKRIFEHNQGVIPGFTKKYRLKKLVYFEVATDVYAALNREKQIKGWLRSKKVALIETGNPQWEDLSKNFKPRDPSPSFARLRMTTVS